MRPGITLAIVKNGSVIYERAYGYRDTRRHAGGAPTSRFDNSWVGAAGLVGTITDMIAWERALSEGAVVSPQSYALMTSVQTPPNDVVRYRFAFFLDRYRGEPRIWQDGSTLGFNVCDQYYPNQYTRLIVFINSNDGTNFADTLAQQVFDLLYPSSPR